MEKIVECTYHSLTRQIMKKLNLAVIFGGKSAEHEVSIISARNIIKAIDKSKYDIVLVGISRDGEWYNFEKKELLSEKELFPKDKQLKNKEVISFTKKGKFILKIGKLDKHIDVVFPVLHGSFGEDGTMQGLLKLYNVPFVGPSVLGSAVSMDKDVTKRLLEEAKIPIAKFLVFENHEREKMSFKKITKYLGLPIFIKPANLGSSVGISKISNENEFNKAIRTAFSFDKKIIIEEFIKGREIECSVLGNTKLIASVPGEIVPTHDFYTYEAKYLDEGGAKTVIPAKLPKNIIKKIQNTATKTFRILCCEGMGRVDFFISKKNKIIVNEINTIPGFTSISMYPKLLEKSGISYSYLIDSLIKLAIERHETESKFKIIR